MLYHDALVGVSMFSAHCEGADGAFIEAAFRFDAETFGAMDHGAQRWLWSVCLIEVTWVVLGNATILTSVPPPLPLITAGWWDVSIALGFSAKEVLAHGGRDVIRQLNIQFIAVMYYD